MRLIQLTEREEKVTQKPEKQVIKNEAHLLLQLENQAQQIERLTEQIEYLTRKLFGTSSEKSSEKNQLSLFDEEESFFDQAETTEEETVEVTATKRPKEIGRKTALTKHIPVTREVQLELSEEERACDACGTTMQEMGTVTREELVFIPSRLEKIQYHEHTYHCLTCKEGVVCSIKRAEAARQPIQNSLSSPSILAQLFHQKYEMALPLYRQVKEWLSWGLDVTRRTLSNWVIRSSHDWLLPMYNRLHQILVKEDILMADETPYQILQRSDGRPATSEARVWLFRTMADCVRPIILYQSALTREKKVAEEALTGFSGYLQTDGYSAYQNLANISQVGCWSHARRKFVDCTDKKGKAAIGIDYCDKLFRLEREFDSEGLSSDERFKNRQERSQPIVDDFFDWLTSFHTMKGKLQEAVTYALNQEESLRRFLEDGRLELSNNLSERSIKAVVIGRKNYLFSTSMAGAQANAFAHSIVETALANGLNATRYLEHLFTHLPSLNFLQQPDLLDAYLPWSETSQALCRQQTTNY